MPVEGGQVSSATAVVPPFTSVLRFLKHHSFTVSNLKIEIWKIEEVAMRAFIIAVPIAVALSACTTPAERAAQAQREVERMVEIYGPACTKLGFAANTDPWRSCIINLSKKDEHAADHRHAFHGYYGWPYWRHPNWAYW